MLEIYLGTNEQRNKQVLAFLDAYGIPYNCRDYQAIDRLVLLDLFSKSRDCFDLLAPSFLRFKRQYAVSLGEMVELVLRQPERHIRLPLIVHQGRVYPDVTLDDARTFIPRPVKKQVFRDKLEESLMG